MGRLEKLEVEMSALVRIPKPPERAFLGQGGAGGPIIQPIRFRCVFRPYVLVRLAPTTCAAALAQVRHGEIVEAVGVRGRWVRLKVPPRPSDGLELQRWVLTWHPMHGELLHALDVPHPDGPQLPTHGFGVTDL